MNKFSNILALLIAIRQSEVWGGADLKRQLVLTGAGSDKPRPDRVRALARAKAELGCGDSILRRGVLVLTGTWELSSTLAHHALQLDAHGEGSCLLLDTEIAGLVGAAAWNIFTLGVLETDSHREPTLRLESFRSVIVTPRSWNLHRLALVNRLTLTCAKAYHRG